MIPKIINYCWFGGKPLPSNVKKCIETWKKYAPDYQIIEWNESNFDINCHHFIKKAYEAKAWAFVSDYARLKVVYENGGIYFDTDVELLRNIDFLLEKEFFICAQQIDKKINTGLGFGAVQNSEVVLKMLKCYDRLDYDDRMRSQLACPALNNSVLYELGYRYSDSVVELSGGVVLPSRYMDPVSPGNTRDLLCEDTISIHHYDASWTPFLSKLKRKIVLAIGQQRINKFKTYFRM